MYTMPTVVESSTVARVLYVGNVLVKHRFFLFFLFLSSFFFFLYDYSRVYLRPVVFVRPSRACYYSPFVLRGVLEFCLHRFFLYASSSTYPSVIS